MTRAEYLEFAQEAMCFPTDMPDHIMHMDAKPGLYPCDPDFALRDTPEVCDALRVAHENYCAAVELILFPERAAEIEERMTGMRELAGYEARLRATMAVQPLTGMSTGLIDAVAAQGDAVAAQNREALFGPALTGAAQDEADAKKTHWELQAEHSIVS